MKVDFAEGQWTIPTDRGQYFSAQVVVSDPSG